VHGCVASASFLVDGSGGYGRFSHRSKAGLLHRVPSANAAVRAHGVGGTEEPLSDNAWTLLVEIQR
jgi:hypothetical protein